ncbi:hypothetical protein K439DRAFT_1621393 [Ramaria rubella]|nr:hypothetical protein K439DRAFT_1621393 [Ramaria rubella]
MQDIPTQATLNQEDYPLVTFWTCKDWDTARTTHVLGFMTNHEGELTSAEEITQIHATAHVLWRSLLDEGQAPDKWGSITCTAEKYYRSNMYQEHPDLALC